MSEEVSEVSETAQKLIHEFAGVMPSAITDICNRFGNDYDTCLAELLKVISDGSVALKSGPAPQPREKVSSHRSERKKRQDRVAKELKTLRRELRAQGVPKAEIKRQLEERLRAPVVDKLLQTANKNSINLMANPRDGKKLLVLDLDYTLFDYKSEFDTVEDLHALKRPHLEEFLISVYQEYDLVVWSQSTWQRLERVLTSLDVLTKRTYRFVFVLDRSAMYEVTREVRKGKLLTHEVKDLHYIWGKFPDFYNPCNTLHVDDLVQNFAMNKENGVPIKAFDSDLRQSGKDDSLRRLAKYLLHIAPADDLTQFEHDKWEEYDYSASSIPELPYHQAQAVTTTQGQHQSHHAHTHSNPLRIQAVLTPIPASSLPSPGSSQHADITSGFAGGDRSGGSAHAVTLVEMPRSNSRGNGMSQTTTTTTTTGESAAANGTDGGEDSGKGKKKKKGRFSRKLSSLRDRWRSGSKSGGSHERLVNADDDGDDDIRGDTAAGNGNGSEENGTATCGGLMYYYDEPIRIGDEPRGPFAWLPGAQNRPLG